jgi:hypothetical protein
MRVIKEDERGGARGTHRRDVKCISYRVLVGKSEEMVAPETDPF